MNAGATWSMHQAVQQAIKICFFTSIDTGYVIALMIRFLRPVMEELHGQHNPSEYPVP